MPALLLIYHSLKIPLRVASDYVKVMLAVFNLSFESIRTFVAATASLDTFKHTRNESKTEPL
jgi:hypothetical protein